MDASTFTDSITQAYPFSPSPTKPLGEDRLVIVAD